MRLLDVGTPDDRDRVVERASHREAYVPDDPGRRRRRWRWRWRRLGNVGSHGAAQGQLDLALGHRLDEDLRLGGGHLDRHGAHDYRGGLVARVSLIDGQDEQIT